MKALAHLFLFILITASSIGQSVISGEVRSEEGEILAFANIFIKDAGVGGTSDENGAFSFQTDLEGNHDLIVSYVGYLSQTISIDLSKDKKVRVNFNLRASPELEEVVVTGTLKEMSRKDSPVPVEVYSPTFFKKNPTPSLYESMHNVNGVRPQLNCNVCNTGDIHINGLEGAYTMVMIDGMPIVSGLSTVYGLMGIPNSMVERVEIIKGPASSLYGSEAIGGLVNVITKDPNTHSRLYAEMMTTSWMEAQLDLGFRTRISEKIDVLTGLHLYHYDNPIDNNGDNFTDVTLSKRLSVFQKWNFNRRDGRIFTLGGRYYTENRWGGEMQWTPEFRGGDSIYGESIYTDRFEFFSKYQLPVREKMMLWTSFNRHLQDSYYGDMPFNAEQNIAFAQLTWEKKLYSNQIMVGAAGRYTYYDDNTVATGDTLGNLPDEFYLPGIFVQDDIELSKRSRLLLGLRFDYHSAHGSIWTPRIAYKFKFNERNSIRLNAGTGFRVVNIFTEDHAALTGARDVLISENLEPERSVNYNLNYLKKIYSSGGNYWGIDFSLFHSRFSNKIIADYDTDPNQIIYSNLDGFAVSQGVTVNVDAVVRRNWRMIAGITFTDVFAEEKNEFDEFERFTPVLTERWSGSWTISYTFAKPNISIDYTGTVYGPMRLPLLGPLDPRNEYSPWWSLQNIQLTYKTSNDALEIFGGIKNLLNYLPPANSIARAHDPFDKEVEYDNDGNVLSTPNNPYALTFDPSYVYAPNQGIRFFVGLRYNIFQ